MVKTRTFIEFYRRYKFLEKTRNEETFFDGVVRKRINGLKNLINRWEKKKNEILLVTEGKVSLKY